MSRVIQMVGVLWIFAAPGNVAAQTSPFFEHRDLLNAMYGVEMVLIRLAAIAAVEHPPQELAALAEKIRTVDVPRFAGSLEEANPELRVRITAAVDDVLQARCCPGDAAGLAAVDRAESDIEEVVETLVPQELRDNHGFGAALMAMLLLSGDGVAEAYEEAADGSLWDYPTGWAALRRVQELWLTVGSGSSAENRLEVEDALQSLDALFPTPIPPTAFQGDPEEAESPAQRMVGFLEATTGALLYPDRDLASLATLIQSLAGDGCEAYRRGSILLASERISAAAFHYDESMRRVVHLFAPELHERIEVRLQALRRTDMSLDVARTQCTLLLESVRELRSLFAT